MNKVCKIIPGYTFLALVFCVLLFFHARAADEFPAKPNPPRLVNDLANMLSADERARLENKLVAFDDSTSTQITVVTVQTINGYDINDYKVRLGDKWGVGRKGKNNGVVLLIAKEEREAAIATGYGMEGVLTDALSKRIIERYIVPNFRNSNYYKGLDEATDAIIQVSKGEFKAEEHVKPSAKMMIVLIVCLVIFFIIISSIINRNKYSTLSGKGHTRNRWGGPWTGGGFGGFGGGGWGGGSSGGGGFGGFGGGGFGGGGASGKW